MGSSASNDSSGAVGDGSLRELLAAALAEADDDDLRFHIRQALQHARTLDDGEST